ncbi:hypothetical protein BLX88_25465, partial [Bacillus obstructivus]
PVPGGGRARDLVSAVRGARRRRRPRGGHLLRGRSVGGLGGSAPGRAGEPDRGPQAGLLRPPLGRGGSPAEGPHPPARARRARPSAPGGGRRRVGRARPARGLRDAAAVAGDGRHAALGGLARAGR